MGFYFEGCLKSAQIKITQHAHGLNMAVMILSGGYGIEGSCGVVVNDVEARLKSRKASKCFSEMTSLLCRSWVRQGVGNPNNVKTLKEMASRVMLLF